MKVTVDNEKEVIIDTFFENGWGDYSATEILVKSNEKSLHEIKIEVIDFNEKSIVNILGFLVSQKITLIKLKKLLQMVYFSILTIKKIESLL